MTLDMEAVKRRAGFKGESKDHPFIGYKSVARDDSHVWLGEETRADIDAHLDRRDLIAEVERLTAKLEDQNERIAQLHRERGEAVAEVGRLRAELDRALTAGHEAAQNRDAATTHARQLKDENAALRLRLDAADGLNELLMRELPDVDA